MVNQQSDFFHQICEKHESDLFFFLIKRNCNDNGMKKVAINFLSVEIYNLFYKWIIFLESYFFFRTNLSSFIDSLIINFSNSLLFLPLLRARASVLAKANCWITILCTSLLSSTSLIWEYSFFLLGVGEW